MYPSRNLHTFSIILFVFVTRILVLFPTLSPNKASIPWRPFLSYAILRWASLSPEPPILSHIHLVMAREMTNCWSVSQFLDFCSLYISISFTEFKENVKPSSTAHAISVYLSRRSIWLGEDARVEGLFGVIALLGKVDFWEWMLEWLEWMLKLREWVHG